jgi:hypothetical protein
VPVLFCPTLLVTVQTLLKKVMHKRRPHNQEGCYWSRCGKRKRIQRTGVFMAEGCTWYNEVVINRHPELSEFFFARDLQESEEK